jgi:hypothetical protein
LGSKNKTCTRKLKSNVYSEFWRPSYSLQFKVAQWKIISITSLEVEWKAVVPRKAKFHSEKKVKWTWKPQKIRLSFLISQQKRLFDQNSFTIQMSLGVFQFFYFHGFDVYFAYFSVWNFICQICGLIRQAKRSWKIPIFSTVCNQIFHLRFFGKLFLFLSQLRIRISCVL